MFAKLEIEGSIPAWAGEPERLLVLLVLLRVYPRVGGGTAAGILVVGFGGGLSPRGRGNRYCFNSSSNRSGSIPAWAGEPADASSAAMAVWVYPRVGGGTFLCAVPLFSFEGLSPRGRGNRWRPLFHLPAGGSIPAWAGEPLGIKALNFLQCQRAVGSCGALFAFYEQHAVCVHDFFRRLAEGFDTQVSDRGCVSPDHDNRTRAERRPPARQHVPDSRSHARRQSGATYTPGATSSMMEVRNPRYRASTLRVTINAMGIGRYPSSAPSANRDLIRSIIAGMIRSRASSRPVRRRVTRSTFSAGCSLTRLAARKAQGIVTVSR